MYDLIVSELAHKDLDGIVSYIAVQLANPEAACNLIREVERCYDFLQSNPSMYELCRDKRLSASGYRKAPIGNFAAVYRFSEQPHTVTILRFFYGARDYANLI